MQDTSYTLSLVRLREPARHPASVPVPVPAKVAAAATARRFAPNKFHATILDCKTSGTAIERKSLYLLNQTHAHDIGTLA
jgi:hypothetical protein